MLCISLSKDRSFVVETTNSLRASKLASHLKLTESSLCETRFAREVYFKLRACLRDKFTCQSHQVYLMSGV